MSGNPEKDKRDNKPTSSGQKTIDDTFTRDMFCLLKSDLPLNLIIESKYK